MSTWTNRQLESDIRATVFSMSAQLDAFGQVASGPPMGAVATRTAVRVACWRPPRFWCRRRPSSLASDC